MTSAEILQKLPYNKPFLFVDTILEVDEDGIKGEYTFTNDETFYKGHFTNNPVTPGVILTECCAQIGLVCFGVFLMAQEGNLESPKVAFSENQMEYLLPVYPNETVTVVSERVYFRFEKLKCKVKMFNADKELVCKGTLSGMIINESHEG